MILVLLEARVMSTALRANFSAGTVTEIVTDWPGANSAFSGLTCIGGSALPVWPKSRTSSMSRASVPALVCSKLSTSTLEFTVKVVRLVRNGLLPPTAATSVSNKTVAPDLTCR